jgi:hypothetical protein
MLRLIRKEAVLPRIFPHFDAARRSLRILTSKRTPCGENESTMTPSLIALTELLKFQKIGQFPDDPVRIEV